MILPSLAVFRLLLPPYRFSVMIINLISLILHSSLPNLKQESFVGINDTIEQHPLILEMVEIWGIPGNISVAVQLNFSKPKLTPKIEWSRKISMIFFHTKTQYLMILWSDCNDLFSELLKIISPIQIKKKAYFTFFRLPKKIKL